MRTLTQSDIDVVSGAGINPSEWTVSAAAGASFAAVCGVVTAFSANPLPMLATVATGGSIAAGLHATYDILKAYGL